MPIRDEFLDSRGRVSRENIRAWYAERVPTGKRYAHPSGVSETRASFIERAVEKTYARALEENRQRLSRVTREDVKTDDSGPVEPSDDASALANRIKARMNQGKA